MAVNAEAVARIIAERREERIKKDRARRLRYYHRNKTTINAKEKQAEKWLRRKYGMTVTERNAMLEAQGGTCKICKTTKPGKKGWVIDHCHVTNKVRNVTCFGCNVGMGCFKDNPDLLRAAADYLESHR